jgi:tetratricopeptide (TPR) repeat protein
VRREDGRSFRGSGYQISTRYVLTAAHVVQAATEIQVRFDADRPGERTCLCGQARTFAAIDLAVVPVPADEHRVLLPTRFGRVPDEDVTVTLSAMGFPLHKLRADQTRPMSRYRDSAHIRTAVQTLSNRREGTLEITVDQRQLPAGQIDAEQSPWEGMSGSVVFDDDIIVGVVSRYRRSDRTLVARRVDRWYEMLSAAELMDLVDLLGLPLDATDLTVTGGVAASAAAAVAAVETRLPPPVLGFTDRDRELEVLRVSLGAHTGASAGASVQVIAGMAGVGKTALAVRAAREMAAGYRDGQLFLDLHGYAVGRQPVRPAEALEMLLREVGVPAEQIPRSQEQREQLWRGRVGDKHLVLVLDNVAETSQASPLLPGTSSCPVLVTSRRRLTGLHGTQVIMLDMFALPDAVALFRRLAGPGRIEDSDVPAVERIVALCGLLPLAIRLVAAQLRGHQGWTLAELEADLTQTSDRLQVIGTDDLAVRTAFDLSYRELAPALKLLFRTLALHPGDEITSYAAAALTDLPLTAAERGMETFFERNLLDQPAAGRYRFHDLVRMFARELAEASETPADRGQAIDWLEDYYLAAAYDCERLVVTPGRHGRRPVEFPPAEIPRFTDEAQTRSWLHAELPTMVACARLAVRNDERTRVFAYADLLGPHLRDVGRLDQAIELYRAAIGAASAEGDRREAADPMAGLAEILQRQTDYTRARALYLDAQQLYREAGDLAGQGRTLRGLGLIGYLLDELPQANEYFQEGYRIFTECGDQIGQAQTLHGQGTVAYLSGDLGRAAGLMDQVLQIYRERADLLGQADTLWSLGNIAQRARRFDDGRRHFTECLALYRELNDRLGEASGLWGLAIVALQTGMLEEAAEHYEQSRRLYRELGDRLGEANTLVGTGRVDQQAGRYDEALDRFMQAYAIYLDTDVPRGEADALAAAGTTHRLRGRPDEAVAALSRAVDLYQQIGAFAEAESARAELDAIPPGG